MKLIIYIGVGILSGWIAQQLAETESLTFPESMAVAIFGAVFGGFIFGTLGATQSDLWVAAACAAIGAIVFLLITNLLLGIKKPHDSHRF